MERIEPPVGTIIVWPGPLSTIPDGWKLCNGEYLLGTKYQDLLSVLQDYWGPFKSDGATRTFRLPDLRGVFIRGVNEERNDNFEDPEKNTRESSKGISNEVGSFQQDALQIHVHQVGSSTSDKQASSQLERSRFADFVHIDNKEVHKTKGPIAASIMGEPPRVAPETRPKNAYVNYIIKVI